MGWKVDEEIWHFEKFSYFFSCFNIIYGKNFTTSLKVTMWWLNSANSAGWRFYTQFACDPGVFQCSHFIKVNAIDNPGRSQRSFQITEYQRHYCSLHSYDQTSKRNKISVCWKINLIRMNKWAGVPVGHCPNSLNIKIPPVTPLLCILLEFVLHEHGFDPL